jgi:hypothetical protein
MRGRLIHHAMEWLASRFARDGAHASHDQLRSQLADHFRVLYARGIRTAFESKDETLDGVAADLFPGEIMHPTVKVAVEGATHTEYELRTVRKILPVDFAGKSRLMLTGILDLVVQQTDEWVHPRSWEWTNPHALEGRVVKVPIHATADDLEIWDYKGTSANTPFTRDYVLQLLTYAGLYAERTGNLPSRCVLFFVNEDDRDDQLVAIPIDEQIVQLAQQWTIDEARRLRATMLEFEGDPLQVEAGGLDDRDKPVGERVSDMLKQQCTACSLRFDCAEYRAHLGRADHPDVDMTNVRKN